MYIRKTKKTVKGKTYTNHLLVESVTTPDGPRQKTICSLGDLAPRPWKEWLLLARKLEDALVGQMHLDDADDPEVQAVVEKVRSWQKKEGGGKEKGEEESPSSQASEDEVVSVVMDKVEMEKVREAGPVHVGLEFYNRLGLDEILRQCGLSPRARTLTSVMVMNRLIRVRVRNTGCLRGYRGRRCRTFWRKMWIRSRAEPCT